MYNWVYNIQIYRAKNEKRKKMNIVSSIKIILNNNTSRNKLHQLLFYSKIIHNFLFKFLIHRLFAKLHPFLTNQNHNVIIEVSYEPFFFFFDKILRIGNFNQIAYIIN